MPHKDKISILISRK